MINNYKIVFINIIFAILLILILSSLLYAGSYKHFNFYVVKPVKHPIEKFNTYKSLPGFQISYKRNTDQHWVYSHKTGHRTRDIVIHESKCPDGRISVRMRKGKFEKIFHDIRQAQNQGCTVYYYDVVHDSLRVGCGRPTSEGDIEWCSDYK